MPKIRVHELAKQLGVGNKEILAKLEGYGAAVSTHSSSVDDAYVERIKTDLGKSAPTPAKADPAPKTADSTGDIAPQSERKPRPVDAEGRPIGPDGNPLTKKPRPVDAEGRPIGPDGKPLQRRPRPVDAEGRPLGPDGKPLQRRPRPVDAEGRPLGPDGKPLQRRPRPVDAEGRPLGPDGKPLQRRPRPVDAEGRPIGPDGKPLQRKPRPVDAEGRPIGPDGKPLVRKPRPVDAEGRPIGPDGRPLVRKPRPAGEDAQPQANAVSNIAPPPTETPKATDSTQPASGDAVAVQAPKIDVGSEGTPVGEKPTGPDGRPLRPAGERPPRPLGPDGRPLRPAGDRPPRPLGPDGRPLRPAGDRPPRPLGPDGRPLRPAGDRPPRPLGPDGRPIRPAGDRPPRPLGPDGRPIRPAGDRPPRLGPDGRPIRTGDRPPRPDGQRPAYGDRPPRPAGDRPPYSGDRRPAGPGGSRPPMGGRPGGGPGAPRGPGAGGRPAGGPGGARGGAPSPVKKGEPTKDDRKSQWGRSAQARSTQKDKNERKESGIGGRPNRPTRGGPKPVKKVMPKMPDVTEITVAAEITIRDLAEKLHRSNADIIKILMKKGVMVTANQTVDFETASFVAESFNVIVEEYIEVDAFDAAFTSEPDGEDDLLARPPVVVVMGHVDHGKTSLLDVIRAENVQASEAGGITQHIGAYSTSINGKAITFLDTPGHEAFTAMRMRGAQVTDIAILVVAADDGVMPQTIEAINHAKAAGVEIIVAINKMDKPDANPDRVKQELTEHGLQSEDWGGETITVPVSALQKTGIDTLLEMILLVAEMKELKANPNKAARGSIIEAKLDKGRGPVATVLVQSGTLKIGDPVVAGACFGKVRAMTDSRGRNLKEAGPSTPVEIIGLAEVPVTGDILYTAQSEKQARQLSETVVAKGRVNMIKSTSKVSLDDLFSQIQAGQVKDLNIVVKADVQGSVEALRGSLDKLSNNEVRVRIIHTGVGAINESDVMLASASNAIIIGFNVRPDTSAKSTSETEGVDIRTYSVIYAAIDDIEAAMKGMLDPEFEEKIMGHAEIRQVFKASSVGNIAGCYVTDGRITRNAQVRLVRDGRVIYDGTLDTLKRFKDDTREVAQGYECGMLFKNYSDIKEGDKVEAYTMEEIPR